MTSAPLNICLNKKKQAMTGEKTFLIPNHSTFISYQNTLLSAIFMGVEKIKLSFQTYICWLWCLLYCWSTNCMNISAQWKHLITEYYLSISGCCTVMSQSEQGLYRGKMSTYGKKSWSMQSYGKESTLYIYQDTLILKNSSSSS